MVMEVSSSNEGPKEWISPEEKALVKKLRERVRDDLPEDEFTKSEDDQDAFLLRWLRARDLNLEKAESLIKSTIKWRYDNNVDKALEWEVDPYLKENYQWKCLGADLEGRPVFICPLYSWDLRKMIAANKTDLFNNFLQYFFEDVMREIRLCNEKRKPGQPPVTQFCPIYDVNAFPYGQMLSFGAMRKWFQAATTYEAYYPEILHRAVFINCPSYFQMFINMLKSFLCPRTLGKFMCFSTVDDWRKEIEKNVDPALVPVQYGGTCQTNPLDRPSSQG